ncbi:MAG TPA: hypothetical protein VIM94_04255 [Salegentibacter sp.]
MPGPIEKNKKKRKEEQKNPVNPSGNKEETNEFDIDEKTIKDQQNKK